MAKGNILIVDDEPDVSRLLTMRLENAGFNVHSVLSGKEALLYTDTNTPDLILLDIMMPGMDGFEVLQKLHADAKKSAIPAIALTARSGMEDKVKFFKFGIDDYITKPYDAQELIARIEVVLRRAKKTTQPPVISKEDKLRVDFLKSMLDNNIKELIPEYNMNSLSGYGYPIAANFFKVNDGSEIDHIEFLVNKGCFEKRFFDRVLLCPYCMHHDINIRETCPTTHSANISIVEMIHHFRCGYTGIEEEFKKGTQYICPKCEHELKQIGVDYDKPGQSFVCNDNGEKFTEPDVSAQCRNCKKIFEIDNAMRQDIFKYPITEDAAGVVESGRFIDLNMDQILLDTDVEVYSNRYFKKRLDEELDRAEKFKEHFSIVMVNVLNFDELTKKAGFSGARRMLNDIATLLKENLWKINIHARYDKSALITLLPEADKSKALELERFINKKLNEYTSREHINVKVSSVSYPEDGRTDEELLNKLINMSGKTI